jgi:hypothetical protein
MHITASCAETSALQHGVENMMAREQKEQQLYSRVEKEDEKTNKERSE